MQKLSLIATVFVFASFAFVEAGQSDEKSSMPVRTRKNVAHRGFSAKAPENTISAYTEAIQAGADGAECDVYATSDGVIILGHDKSTKRTMGGADRDLTKMTFEEIRKLDAGSWKDKRYTGELVPTLDEFLQTLKGTECHAVVEIKMEGIEKPVLDAIRRNDMLDVSSIIAFSPAVVKEIRRREPNICVGFLYGEDWKDKFRTVASQADMLIKRCRELDTTVLDIKHTLLSEPLVQKLREAGIHVWCWTVNDPARMELLLDWGVESITTDHPDKLAEVFGKRERR